MQETKSDYALFDDIPSVIIVIDERGRVVFANNSVYTVLGYSVSSVLWMGWYELISSSNKQDLIDKLKSIYSQSKSKPLDNYFFQHDLKTKKGKSITIEWNAKIKGNELICIGTDITKRIEAQSELKKANVETLLIQSFYNTLLSGNKFKDQIEEVLHELRSNFPLIHRASIVTFDESTNSAFFHRKGNIEGDGIHSTGTTSLNDFRTYRELQKKDQVLVHDLRKEKKLLASDKEIFEDGVLSYIGCPLKFNGKIIGVLMAGSKHANIFTDFEIRIIQSIADSFAVALHQHNLRIKLTKENNFNKLLLKEVHHRVKNNLQIVISLLNLQFKDSEDPFVQDALTKSTDRIQSMSMLHKMLYNSTNIGSINISNYLEQLIKSVKDSYTTDKEITYTIDSDKGIEFGLDLSINLGLLVTEIFTNAFKHAFTNQNEGIISVKLKNSEGSKYMLSVQDNGRGFNSDHDNSDSLGLIIIEALTSQIDGSYAINSEDGVEIIIIFDATI